MMLRTDDRRTIISEWADQLIRWPIVRRGRTYLNAGNRYCALGVFADICTRRLSEFEWRPSTNYRRLSGEDMVTYAVVRKGYSGEDALGLPEELRWILGFSGAEARAISALNDRGKGFDTIAAYLWATYLADSVWEKRDPWTIVESVIPERDRSPEFIDRISHISAWDVPIGFAAGETYHSGSSVPHEAQSFHQQEVVLS